MRTARVPDLTFSTIYVQPQVAKLVAGPALGPGQVPIPCQRRLAAGERSSPLQPSFSHLWAFRWGPQVLFVGLWHPITIKYLYTSIYLHPHKPSLTPSCKSTQLFRGTSPCTSDEFVHCTLSHPPGVICFSSHVSPNGLRTLQKKHREPWHKVSMVDEALDAKQSAKLGAQQDVPESAATWEANSLNHFGS